MIEYLRFTNSDVAKIATYISVFKVPAVIIVNGTKYIVSLESDDVIDMLQIRYNGELQIIQKVKGGYLICRPY